MINTRLRLGCQRVGCPAQKCTKVQYSELYGGHAFVRISYVDQTGYGVVESPTVRSRHRIAVNVTLDPCSFSFVRSVYALLIGFTRWFVYNFVDTVLEFSNRYFIKKIVIHVRVKDLRPNTNFTYNQYRE